MTLVQARLDRPAPREVSCKFVYADMVEAHGIFELRGRLLKELRPLVMTCMGIVPAGGHYAAIVDEKAMLIRFVPVDGDGSDGAPYSDCLLARIRADGNEEDVLTEIEESMQGLVHDPRKERRNERRRA